MGKKIVNKVANSGLVTIDIEKLLPTNPIKFIDIKDHLFKGLVLKEKDFRNFIKTHDWSSFQNCYVGVYCSVDAIIPIWAFMLLSSSLTPFAESIYYSNPKKIESLILADVIDDLNESSFKGKRVVIKGCGEKNISNFVFIKLTKKLQPFVLSIMYGEPCSTVPIYKKNN